MEDNTITQNRQNPQAQENYFSLIQKVGSHGCYQWIVYLIVILGILLSSFSLNNLPYLFKNPSFDCSNIEGIENLSTEQCDLYICKNFQGVERQGLLIPLTKESVSTQFGPYLCQDSHIIGSIRGIIFLGAFIGIFPIVYLADNYSRRRAYLLCIAFQLLGNMIVVLSPNIQVLAFGQFTTGLGSMIVLKMSTVILSEIAQKKLRQHFLTSSLLFFGLGIMIFGYAFQAIGNWRKSLLFLFILPSIIWLISTIFFLQDTPKYILRRYSAEKAADKLNWIAKINNNQYRYSPHQLRQKIEQQQLIKTLKKTVSPIDLFNYKSLRIPTLLFCFCGATANIVYYSHNFISEYIGISMSFNMMIIGMGDISGYILAVFFVDKVDRVYTGFICMMLGSLIRLIAFLIQVPNECNFCSEGIFQIFLIGIGRIIHEFWWGIFFNHLIQFYPVSIRSIGTSSTTAASAIALFLNEYILTLFKQKGLNFYYCIVIVGIVCGIVFKMTPQTKDEEDKDQIDEISQILDHQKEV